MKKLAMSKKHRIKIRQAMKTLFKTTAIRYSIYSGLFIYNFNKIIARSNCQLSLDLAESKGIPEKKKSISASLTMLKPLTLWIATHWKILKEMGISDDIICLPRNRYVGEEAIVRARHGAMTISKLGMEYVKVVYCSSAYLISIPSTSCEMPGWMTINNFRYADDVTPVAKSCFSSWSRKKRQKGLSD